VVELYCWLEEVKSERAVDLSRDMFCPVSSASAVGVVRAIASEMEDRAEVAKGMYREANCVLGGRERYSDPVRWWGGIVSREKRARVHI
jgi:hypothetical protein